MRVSRALLVIGCLLCGTSEAYADKITFDTVPAEQDNLRVFHHLWVNGFIFTVSFQKAHVITNPQACDTGCADNGTQWIGGDIDHLLLTHVNGLFSLSGFDAAEAFTSLNVPATLTLVGRSHPAPSMDQTLSAVFRFDGINDSIGPLADFQSFTLGSEWNQLGSVTFTTLTTPENGWFGIDNVVVTAENPIPEPTSVVLLATGLAALSSFRIYRRH